MNATSKFEIGEKVAVTDPGQTRLGTVTKVGKGGTTVHVVGLGPMRFAPSGRIYGGSEWSGPTVHKMDPRWAAMIEDSTRKRAVQNLRAQVKLAVMDCHDPLKLSAALQALRDVVKDKDHD